MVRRRENINRVWWNKCQAIHNRNRAASEWRQLGKAQGLLYFGRSKRKYEAQTALVTVSVTLCPGWLLLLSFEPDEMFMFGATGLQLSLSVLSQTRSVMSCLERVYTLCCTLLHLFRLFWNPSYRLSQLPKQSPLMMTSAITSATIHLARSVADHTAL